MNARKILNAIRNEDHSTARAATKEVLEQKIAERREMKRVEEAQAISSRRSGNNERGVEGS